MTIGYHAFVDLLSIIIYCAFCASIWPLKPARYISAIACAVLIYHLGIAYGSVPVSGH